MRTRRPRARKPAFKRLVIDSLPRGAPAVGYSGVGFFMARFDFLGRVLGHA